MKVSQQIKLLFTMLSDTEKQVLLTELSSSPLQFPQNVEGSVTSCPHCGARRIVKNGKPGGRTRYKCKSCNRNFNGLTGTAFHGIKKHGKFEHYKSIMFEEGIVPLKKMSERLGISIQTAFDWRHKILSTLKPEEGKFSGVTEMDDVWFLYSQKGRKGLSYSRKRGGSSRRGDNNFQVKMLVTTDRVKTTARALKDWKVGFNGVSTKYLQNYMSWFMVLEQVKGKTDRVKEFALAALVSTNAWGLFKSISLNHI